MEEKYIGGMILSEWEKRWQPIGFLDSVNLEAYGQSVGLFRFEYDGVIVYIGKAVEKGEGRGLKKRLTDFGRKSPSARNYESGERSYVHKDKIQVSVLIMDEKFSFKDINDLKKAMMAFHKPSWMVGYRDK